MRPRRYASVATLLAALTLGGIACSNQSADSEGETTTPGDDPTNEIGSEGASQEATANEESESES